MLAVVGVAVLVVWPDETEPSYQGRTLTEWLLYERPAEAPAVTRNPQVEAIRHIGTNALPFLLKWGQYEPPAWRRVARAAVWRLNCGIRLDDPQADRAEAAWLGFQILGAEASPAIPGLAKLMNGRNSFLAYKAVCALGDIGRDALPVLVAGLTNQQADIRVPSVSCIGAVRNLGTNKNLVVNALIECLRGKDTQMATCAASSLGRLAVEPEVVVPALTEAFHRLQGYERECVVHALGRFGEQARSAVPCLVRALEDSDNSVRTAATNALMEIAPEVLQVGRTNEGR